MSCRAIKRERKRRLDMVKNYGSYPSSRGDLRSPVDFPEYYLEGLKYRTMRSLRLFDHSLFLCGRHPWCEKGTWAGIPIIMSG